MANLNAYFITEAEDREEARDNVASWLFDYLGREFYEEYEVSETDVKRVYELPPGYLEKALADSSGKIIGYEKTIEKCKKDNCLAIAGSAYMHIGHILMEYLCEDMPFWNMLTGDWSLPDADDWAVMVTLG